jgi:hypothetical protein
VQWLKILVASAPNSMHHVAEVTSKAIFESDAIIFGSQQHAEACKTMPQSLGKHTMVPPPPHAQKPGLSSIMRHLLRGPALKNISMYISCFHKNMCMYVPLNKKNHTHTTK